MDTYGRGLHTGQGNRIERDEEKSSDRSDRIIVPGSRHRHHYVHLVHIPVRSPDPIPDTCAAAAAVERISECDDFFFVKMARKSLRFSLGNYFETYVSIIICVCVRV